MQPGILPILGLAASVSLLAGWRLYLTVLATGLAMRWGALPLPEHLAGLQVLASPWVLAAAGFAAVMEFFADKVAWLDSLWDTIHSLVRPLGGALLALTVVDTGDPAVQVIAFLLGGAGAFVAHGSKTGARAVVNASPEPFSNIVLSTAEDIASAGLLALAFSHPLLAGAVALVLLTLAAWLLWTVRRVLRRWFAPRPVSSPP